MRRLAGVTVLAALVAGAVAAWGGAAPTAEPTLQPAAASSAEVRRRPRLPALPSQVRRRRSWIIGVKCDSPPFGYIDVRGENAGFDVAIARWFSRFAFGRPNRVRFECAPTPARIPLLQQGRVDMVIATFTYTRARDEVIDFSIPYYKATGRLLVPNDSPIRSLRDLGGRRVVTTRGSIYDRWMGRCFRDTNVLTTTTTTEALLALRDRRADAFMWDDTVLLGIANQDPNLRLTNDTFLALPYGIGIRQGDRAMKRWVDSRLRIMQRRDLFMQILRNEVTLRYARIFGVNILRPRNTFPYPAGEPETVCP